jgi:hypothetical protein
LRRARHAEAGADAEVVLVDRVRTLARVIAR